MCITIISTVLYNDFSISRYFIFQSRESDIIKNSKSKFRFSFFIFLLMKLTLRTRQRVSQHRQKINSLSFLVRILDGILLIFIFLLSLKNPVEIKVVDTDFPGFLKRDKHQRVFDTWMYNNEAEMAYIRLWRLYDYVDHFIIIVSNFTHSGVPKTLSFKPFTQDIEKYRKKIHIVYPSILCNNETYPYEDKSWCIEKTQRDYAILYIEEHFQPTENDIILVSDVDEIWTRDGVEFIKNHPPKSFYHVRGTTYFPYYFHFQEKWDVGVVMRYRYNLLKYLTPSQARHFGFITGEYLINTSDIFITHCSYCFSSLNYYKKKITSFAHTEFNQPPYNTNDWIFKSHYCREKIGSFPKEHIDENRSLTEYLPLDPRLRNLYDKSFTYNINQTKYTKEDLKTLCDHDFDRTPFNLTNYN